MTKCCPSCGASLTNNAKTCPQCNQPIPVGTLSSGNVPPTLIISVAQSAATLECVGGTGSGARFPISSPKTKIGRASGCAIVLDDERVSREHAQVECNQGKYVLTDLGSANHTFVNGKMIVAPTMLKSGDRIFIGATTLVFRIGAQSQGASPSQTEMFSPIGRLKQKRAPDLEGVVEHIDGPHQVKRGPGVPAGLGLLASMIRPVLGMSVSLLLMLLGQRTEIAVRFLRIHEIDGSHRSAVLRGDPSGLISQGDHIALWGKEVEGTFVVEIVFNHTTNEMITYV